MASIVRVILLGSVLIVLTIFAFLFWWKFVTPSSFVEYVEELPNYVLIKQIHQYFENNTLLISAITCTVTTVICVFYIIKYMLKILNI